MNAPINGLRSTERYALSENCVEAVSADPPLVKECSVIFADVILSKSSLKQVLQLVADQALGLSNDTHAVVASMPEKKATLTAVAAKGPIEVNGLMSAPEPTPGSDASGQGRTQVVRSLIVEKRWPNFTNHALYCGVQSVLACPLSGDGQVIGSLVFYSSKEAAFESHQASVAQALADSAAVLLSNMKSYEAATALSAQLNEALQSRAVIDQAKGILMVTQGLTADEAFEKIKGISQTTNTKVRELSHQIVSGVTMQGRTSSERV